MVLDLYMVHAENWGLQYAIRTGSAAFSKDVLARRWSEMGYESKGGILHRRGLAFPVREEGELFELLNLPFVEPHQRNR